jgi:hypothetical protein
MTGLVNSGRTARAEGRAKKREDNKVAREGRRMAWVSQKKHREVPENPNGSVLLADGTR